MRRNLLDTSTALIALAQPDRLAPKLRKAILAGDNFLSVVSYWEVVLKSMKGNLKIGNPRTWWADALQQLRAIAVPLRPEHISEIQNLPPIHADPFDHVLVAQAMIEKMIFLTADEEILKYAAQGLTVLS